MIFTIFDRYFCGDPTQFSRKQCTFRIVHYRKKVKISFAAVSFGWPKETGWDLADIYQARKS